MVVNDRLLSTYIVCFLVLLDIARVCGLSLPTPNCYKSPNLIYTVDLPSLELHCSRVNCNRKHKSINQRHRMLKLSLFTLAGPYSV